MALLTKQDILAADDLVTEDVPCPEWGGEVRIKALTARARDVYEGSNSIREGTTFKVNYSNMRARLVALCMVDAQGVRLWSENEVALLGEKSAAAMERVFDRCQQISGIAPQAVEAAAKNSLPAPNGSLPLSSVSLSDSPIRTNSSTDSPAGN